MDVFWAVAPYTVVEILPNYGHFCGNPKSFLVTANRILIRRVIHARRHEFAHPCFLFTVLNLFVVFGPYLDPVLAQFSLVSSEKFLKLARIIVLRASQFAIQILSVVALNLWSFLDRGRSSSNRETISCFIVISCKRT